MTTKEAVDHLREQLKKDKEYYNTWQSNLAMSFYDAAKGTDVFKEDLHYVSNKAASDFLDMLIKNPYS